MSQACVSVVTGVGACLPERVVTNDDLVRDGLDTSDRWIRSRTGIARRRRAGPGTSTGDLAVEAGAAALASAGVPGVDLVVLATTTPDHPCPATAPEVAMRLGLGAVPAFDLAAVCSGFVYALAAGDTWIRSGAAQTVLVIGAETYSTIVDPADRNTAVIFGDGAGAVVLRRGEGVEPGAIAAVDLGSDGSGADYVMIEAGGSRWPDPQGLDGPAAHSLQMKGREVYGHAVRRMTASAQRVLRRLEWPVETLGAFVGHQANQRILDSVADRLGIAAQHRFGNIQDVGNTAAASIPLVLADVVADDRVSPGTRTLLTAFGGGLTWGSVALTWPDCTAGTAFSTQSDQSERITMNSAGPTPYEYLTDVLVEKFEVDRADIAETATFSDLDLDSLAVVELFVTLSDRWRVALDDSEAVPGLTLAATADLVDRARQDQAA